MDWAREWIGQEGWDHRLRVMLDFNQREIRWHKRNVRLDTLCDLWASYIAKDAREKQGGGMGGFPPTGPGGHL